MSTQIKRLFQNSQEFVPITLAEAVVVNTENTGLQQLGITTLDKVLYNTLNLVGSNSLDIESLQSIVNTINSTLAGKQDKITWGEGIEIGEDGSVNVTATNKIELYKIVTVLPTASAECENTIYLVPATGNVSGNYWKEYICVYSESLKIYAWEEIGTVQTDVDLSGYVTLTTFNNAINNINTQIETINTKLLSTITASNVTTSTGNPVTVTYEIPTDLYD